jgi:hypothetical protein
MASSQKLSWNELKITYYNMTRERRKDEISRRFNEDFNGHCEKRRQRQQVFVSK